MIMKELIELYPLRFQAFYQRKIWGGSQIYEFKGLPTPYKDVGETWEISPMDSSESIISVGALAGKSLNEVVNLYGAELLGEQVFQRFGGEFPLLFKLIDAHDTLSLQVHPDDSYAQKHKLGFGKSEAWYVLRSSEDSIIYAGWNKPITPALFDELHQGYAIMDYLNQFNVQPGNLFYLPAGIVHTIGAGCLLLEIQQASNTTFRIFDFFRKDENGQPRDLHINQATEVMDYSSREDTLVDYDANTLNKRVEILSTSHFVLGLIQLTTPLLLELGYRDSFTVLFVEDGDVMLEYPHGVDQLGKGDFILLPATIKEVNLMPVSEQVKLIDCYVPHI